MYKYEYIQSLRMQLLHSVDLCAARSNEGIFQFIYAHEADRFDLWARANQSHSHITACAVARPSQAYLLCAKCKSSAYLRF